MRNINTGVRERGQREKEPEMIEVILNLVKKVKMSI